MIASVLGLVAPMLFRLLEKKFGPGTGSTKMQVVLDAVKPIVGALATSGQLAGPAPEDSQLRQLLESLLMTEKAKPDWSETGTLTIRGETYVVTVVRKL
jgi:hypothetical protein